MRTMTLKYEFVGEPDETGLRQIRALRDIPMWGIKAGDLGGRIGSEECLLQDDEAWVGRESTVNSKSTVRGNSWVENSSVEDSWVENSSVEDSWVENSSVNNSHVEDSLVNDSHVKNSLVKTSRVEHSHVEHSHVGKYSHVEDSLVKTSSVKNSLVEKSRVEHSHVAHTSQVLTIGPLGSRNSALTVVFGEGGVRVATGCFCGTVEELEARARIEHKSEYLRLIPYIMAEAEHRRPQK
jgi:hypothetical protein